MTTDEQTPIEPSPNCRANLELEKTVGNNRSMQRKIAMVNFKKNLHKIIVWPRSIIEVYRFNNIEVFVTYL